MTFIAVPHAAMARIEFYIGTQQFSVNPWFIKNSYVLADQIDLAAAVDATVDTDLLPPLSVSCHYSGTRVYDMRSESAPVEYNNDNAGTGGQGEEFLPVSMCCVLTLYSAQRGRSGRGRLYFAGFAETSWTLGAWNAATATSIEDFYTALTSAAYAIGWTPVVVSKFHAGEQRPTPETYPVTRVDVRSLNVAHQRRRIDRP